MLAPATKHVGIQLAVFGHLFDLEGVEFFGVGGGLAIGVGLGAEEGEEFLVAADLVFALGLAGAGEAVLVALVFGAGGRGGIEEGKSSGRRVLTKME